MHKLTKPVSLLFVFLLFAIGFMLGGFYTQYSTSAVNDGMADGAVVVFNGLLFGFIGLFLALFFVISTSPRTVSIGNRILVLIFTVLLGILIYQYITLEEPDPVDEIPQAVTSPAAQRSYESVLRILLSQK